jgi:hypothetical protein
MPTSLPSPLTTTPDSLSLPPPIARPSPPLTPTPSPNTPTSPQLNHPSSFPDPCHFTPLLLPLSHNLSPLITLFRLVRSRFLILSCARSNTHFHLIYVFSFTPRSFYPLLFRDVAFLLLYDIWLRLLHIRSFFDCILTMELFLCDLLARSFGIPFALTRIRSL